MQANGHLAACVSHTVGKPADLCDHTNPDWVPSLKLGYGASNSSEVAAASDRYYRQCLREKRKACHEQPLNSTKKPRVHAMKGTCSCSTQATPSVSDFAVQTEAAFRDCAVQTDVSMTTISGLEQEISRLQVESQQQQEEINQLKNSGRVLQN